MSLLALRDCSIRFGGLVALAELTFDIEKGEIFGLIGPNGAGKTTVFNLITGVYAPTKGSLEFEGASLAGLRPFEINRRGIARTFQNIRLFGEMTVLDNVIAGIHYTGGKGLFRAIFRSPSFILEERRLRKRAKDLLEAFGLLEYAGEAAHNLPYFAQRRLEIARAMATNPRLLLLDEPAAGGNPSEKKALMGLIRDLRDRHGITILLIEHDMRVVMGICERLLVLDHGHTIARGKPEEIRRHPEVIKAYLGAEVA